VKNHKQEEAEEFERDGDETDFIEQHDLPCETRGTPYSSV
jgi:hypothetical protein